MTDGSGVDVIEEADFVIVGSGAAGATCARWLSAAGRSVVVLEEGAPAKAAGGDALEAMTTLFRDAGGMAAVGADMLPILQGRCVGGTTVINGAIQVPLPEEIWREWVEEDRRWESRLPWRELERARELMGRELSISETPRDLWGGNGGGLHRGLEGRATPTRRNTVDCRGSGRCLQGCPHGAKRSVDVSLLPRAARDGARIYARCEVLRVGVEKGRATVVHGRFDSGRWMTARARRGVILAASAIQTPWLLRRSGIRRGFGRGFQCHPGAAMAGVFKERVFGMPEATQSMESHHWRSQGFKFESLGMPRAFRAARVPGVGAKLAERLERLDQVALWGVAARAQARGRVWHGPFGPLVVYSPTPKDRKILLRGLAVLAEGMIRAGATEVWPAAYGAPDAISTVAEARAIANLDPVPGVLPMVANHLFCGVEVDDQFQAGGVKGLIVADSSLFPSNIGVNPMWAITAVATLVAERWAQ